MMVDRAIWHIEMRLDQPLSVTDLARLVGVSPFHFARTFSAVTGQTPGDYIRARRLTVAAKALAFGSSEILSVALEAGYASHEAFTRAFQSQFGCPPRDVRNAGSTETLKLTEPFTMEIDHIVNVAPPVLQDRPAFVVAGLTLRCSFQDPNGIPALWRAFNEREAEVSEASGAAYGVCYDGDETGFTYLAGMEPDRPETPSGMERLQIPAARYAVFTLSGHISDLPKTVYSIWNKALVDAGLTAAKSPDFEVYNKRFDVETGRGEVGIWIPVTKA
ncbi:MAG: AraC family transcriptional regulator [Pseudomonadota bacterium]